MSFFESIFYMAWRGLAIGLIISAPMGPVGMLCIQRTLDKGRRAGFYTGAGAAVSDLLYCLLTGFGLSFIEEFIERNSNIIQLFGSAVLIAFGIYLFKKNPSKSLRKPSEDHISLQKNMLGGFLFTFSNPLILFLTIGLFARFNFLLPEFTVPQYFTGFAFIFLGALLWWWIITLLINKVRHHFNIRSMWLINKIIGVIILLFAIVGIFTATASLAKSEVVRCWNKKRGFESFSPGWVNSAKSYGHIINNTADTVRLLTETDNADKIDFRFKARNHKPSSKASWGILISGTTNEMNETEETILLYFSTEEDSFDGVSSSPALRITSTVNGISTNYALFSDNTNLIDKVKHGMSGPDPTGRLNFFKINFERGIVNLSGGLHSSEPLVSIDVSEEFFPDSIGFFLAPGASVEFSEIRLTTRRNPAQRLVWDDDGLLAEYLEASQDPLEGYWQILDRSLEETLLKPGGDYRLAMVKAGNGYDIIYLSGATVNSDGWAEGMVKGRLLPSGIGGVWDAEWIDATHRVLDYEVKAQTDLNGILTIQFPYHNSQIRLIRTR